MSFTDSSKRTSPLNWVIQSNDGTNIVAKNTVTKEEFSGSLSDFNNLLKLARPTFDVADAIPSVLIDPITGSPYVASGGGSTVDRELVTLVYRVKTAFSGSSIGDIVSSTQIYDVTSQPILIATVWFNQTINTVLALAPNTANLEPLSGITSLPAGASTESTLLAVSGKLPATLGQKTMANALAVSLASDQSPVSVSGTVVANTGLSQPITDAELRASRVPVNSSIPTAASAVILSLTTAATGTNYTAFSSQVCSAIDIVNNTGVTIEYRRGATGTAMQIPTGAARMVIGITNANQIDIRRTDTSNAQVTLQSEAITT